MRNELFSFVVILVGAAAPSLADEASTKQGTPNAEETSSGNIAPYRRDMLSRIANAWKPIRKNNLTVRLGIKKDGKLEKASIVEGSGDKDEDQNAIKCIEKTEFAPLPKWYKGDKLEFNIDMSKVDSIRSS